MAYNLWCKNHLDENVEHRAECTACNTKGDVVSSNAEFVCPLANEVLKVMGETITGGPTRFRQLSIGGKKQMLLKRSHQDFLKNGKEVKNQMLKDSFKKGLDK